MAIPRFGRKQEYKLVDEDGNEHTYIIKGYRFVDQKMVTTLQKYTVELPALMSQAKILRELQGKFIEQMNEGDIPEEDMEKNFMAIIDGLNDDDYSEDEIKELIQLVKNIKEMEGEISELIYTLGQRGLKRAVYKDEPEYSEEYRQAEKENRITEWIDGQEDIDIDIDHLSKIANIMIELGQPTKSLGGSGKGKHLAKPR